MTLPSDGDICTICFFVLLCVIALILWVACPDDYPMTTENFDPHTWCPLECTAPKGQKEPCEDCPYLGPVVPSPPKEEP